MMRCKAGVNVVVKPDIDLFSVYRMEEGIADSFVGEKEKMIGEQVTESAGSNSKYRIHEMDKNWTDEIFEGPFESQLDSWTLSAKTLDLDLLF